MPNQSIAIDRIFHALASPARRTIVERLMEGAATVKELAAPLGMALPSVMQHLGILEDSGLIRSEKRGRVRTCRIEPKAILTAEEWMARQREIWESRFDRLEDHLEKMKEDRGDA